MAEPFDARTTLEDLKFYEGVVGELRDHCREALSAALASDEVIAQTVAARLREYRSDQYPQPAEMVARAEAVEREVTAWRQPLLVAQGLLAAVSMGLLVSKNKSAIKALEEHQRYVSMAMPDIFTSLAIYGRLAQAETPEERAELFSILSADELRSGERLHAVFGSELERLGQLAQRATLIQAEIADTISAILGYLVARQLSIHRFIEATHYFDDVLPEQRIASEAAVATAVEFTKVAIEFLVTKAGPKLLEQVPIVGLAAGAVTLVIEMRGKRREFRERSAQIQERAKTLIAGGATNEVMHLETALREDAKKLGELRDMVRLLEKFLQESDREQRLPRDVEAEALAAESATMDAVELFALEHPEQYDLVRHFGDWLTREEEFPPERQKQRVPVLDGRMIDLVATKNGEIIIVKATTAASFISIGNIYGLLQLRPPDSPGDDVRIRRALVVPAEEASNLRAAVRTTAKIGSIEIYAVSPDGEVTRDLR